MVVGVEYFKFMDSNAELRRSVRSVERGACLSVAAGWLAVSRPCLESKYSVFDLNTDFRDAVMRAPLRVRRSQIRK